MKPVLAKIEERKREIARHPFYTWLVTSHAPLDRRFDFAPVLVNFIMSFSDMNKWFMRYDAPSSDYELAINKHTREDETHSRLFIEDWKKLGLDRRLGFGAGDTLAWYYAAKETEAFRADGMEILGMLAQNEEPLVRFALMEAIESWGHVMFSATAGVAAKLSESTGIEYRYFGPYHLKRELGHLLAGGDLFEEARLSEGQRARALALVDRFFDIAEAESDRLLQHVEGARPSERVPRIHRWERSEKPQKGAARCLPREIHPSQTRLEALLTERKRRAAGHPLFAWMRSGGEAPITKLRHVALFWAPDCMGYRDLNAHALAYEDPASAEERAICQWTTDLGTHHRLFLADWARLGMDERLGFSASDTLDFYCRSACSETQRHSMSAFVKLAFNHPDPALRFWLIEALEASGHAFFESTRRLAALCEAETGPLDYFGDRHDLAHSARDPEASASPVSFEARELSGAQADVAAGMIETVFDCLDRQMTRSLEQATIGARELPFLGSGRGTLAA